VKPYPWLEAMRSSHASAEASLILQKDADQRTFMVKSAPVFDGWGRAKGAIATFDDTTELERKKAELERALTELEKSRDEVRLQNDELQLLARRDPLTGVSNRRAFVELNEKLFEEARRSQRRGAAMMADIDKFKAINDTHGHATGDEVICRVAEALSSMAPSPDAVCRYGGEEFCLFLPDMDVEAAAELAERLRRRIEAPAFARIPVTVSFGVSSIRGGAKTLFELIEQADEALYVSKRTGRNRVTRWDQREAVLAKG
jgi:diguanylate cyclase (GGDEF)-like protein